MSVRPDRLSVVQAYYSTSMAAAEIRLWISMAPMKMLPMSFTAIESD